MLKRIARGLSWGLVGLAAAAVLMMAASLVEVAWTAPSLGGVELVKGRMLVQWRGSVGRVNGPTPGWRIGAPKDRRMTISGPGGGWIGERRWSAWFCSGRALSGGTGPIGVGGSLMLYTITVSLWQTAVVAGGAGVAMFVVSRRRARAGHCAKCGYDLSGLGAGAACPECGVGSAATALLRAVRRRLGACVGDWGAWPRGGCSGLGAAIAGRNRERACR